MSNTNKMLELAKQARDKAYAPYSKFHVGACIKTKSGNYYSGCNVENASYSLAQCAEGTAICKMVFDGEIEISEVLVIGNTEEMLTPCGACRQKIREFADADTIIHMCNHKDVIKSIKLEELLPHSFGPEILSEK